MAGWVEIHKSLGIFGRALDDIFNFPLWAEFAITKRQSDQTLAKDDESSRESPENRILP
jgi:hypothetical protein